MKVPNDLLGVFCDIDDTLTIDGRIVPGCLDQMVRARELGLAIVPITGRPGGWVDHIARAWPVDGVVGENGGLWAWMDGQKMQRRFLQDESTRVANRKRLNVLAEQILEAVPGTALASDQSYRDLDLAIDFCEDVPALPSSSIDAIVQEFRNAGAECKVSSIHVNGWFGAFDKLVGVERFHLNRWGSPIDYSRWAFFGDSANDEPMFKAFPASIGVSNVEAFLGQMKHHPTWITAAPGGLGFIEGMKLLLP
jgi:HAD superfamily hydrolase (TIGR01484 family)